MGRLAVPCLMALASGAAMAGEGQPPLSAQDEAQALVGGEFGHDAMRGRMSDRLSCTYQGGGVLHVRGREHPGWSEGLALCQGRYVMLLMRFLRGKTNEENRWRVVDAAALPEVVGIEFDPERPEGPYLYTFVECRLNFGGGSEFYAVVRLSKRKRMDWRTGVLSAHGYDMSRQRIVQLSPKHVVCMKPDPD